ncbi:hypothetical protein [Pontibacter litorisediminis]|uniref:hypothetical protein n=1 Tax=Pontibacter litorisediminis TaxID=1846260 RepID=UPI0023ECE476|nr:hypothetical protein [Pontibacter litorisediminis]
MKKATLAVVAITMLVLNQATAQNSRSEEALLENLRSKRIQNRPSGGEVAITEQEGEANVSLVQQVQTSTVANQANVLQVGSYNHTSLQQHGSGIGATISQYGNGNAYEGSLLGNNLQSEVVQQGNGNAVNQQVRGNNLDYSLIQLGNNNTINQIEITPASKSYQVVQEGNNMNITIEQSRGFVPVTVQKQ